MHHPPPGGGYGSPPHAGGYGGPPYPPYGGAPPPFRPPPPKSGSNAAVIVLVIVVAVVVLGAAGCLVGLLAGMSASAGAGDAAVVTADPAATSESTVDRTPTAVALEGALRNDGIPLDHVECPVSPPNPSAFSCAVLPANEGDPAEVTVTLGPKGMAYELQKGFVVLEGAKLATTFAGMTARGASPHMTVPCFNGKILKHADTSFTCEVHSGGATVGYVTTQVIGTSGDVKMSYQPSAQPGAGGRAGGQGGGQRGESP